MFDLREFVMKTLRGMAKSEPGYKVNRYALGWFEKDVLTAEDLAEIDILTEIPTNEEEAGLPQNGVLWEEGGTAEQTSPLESGGESAACPDAAEIDLLTTQPEITEELPEGETQTAPEGTPDVGGTEENT